MSNRTMNIKATLAVFAMAGWPPLLPQIRKKGHALQVKQGSVVIPGLLLLSLTFWDMEMDA